ncbi:GIY-YIG nuclease family protein [Gordonia alkaliphila]|uniref:GIY-YIG nuclease family protein n=1 Tax=Gordonia alkaliphila TaxID=1053547 RepID=A0ABP8YUZ6_9ACTN
MTEAAARPGYIYVLTSPNCSSLKIGRTEKLPPHRLREINQTPAYQAHGPWSIADIVQVSDVVAVESRIHRAIRSRHNSSIEHQNELFEISLAEARSLLRTVPATAEIDGYPKLERCFFDAAHAAYLDALYASAGLSNFVADQGAWTLTLFTTTAGGRFFTMNIGPHEVAYSSTPARGETRHPNRLVVDKLIQDFPEVERWARQRGGGVGDAGYATQRDRATAISFEGDLTEARELLTLPGVRRSLIAYWTEGILEMREQGRESAYKRFHQWNAAAELQRHAEGAPSIVLRSAESSDAT